ncbi:MAG TPA: hypothetical protein VF546_07955 [Pyrinomonadaceae bacterium]|jgi:hypothetical protein
MRPLLRLLAATLALTALAAATARADTPVTSGVISMSNFSGGTFQLYSGKLMLSGGIEDGADPSCFLCPPGSAFAVGAPPRVFSGFVSGPAKVNGVAYARLYYVGTMRLMSMPIYMPAGRSQPRVTFRAPFIFRWDVYGCTVNALQCGSENAVYHDTLAGQGMMSVRMTSLYNVDGGHLYNSRDMRFDFLPAVVMPATALTCSLANLWPGAWQQPCADALQGAAAPAGAIDSISPNKGRTGVKP